MAVVIAVLVVVISTAKVHMETEFMTQPQYKANHGTEYYLVHVQDIIHFELKIW